MNASCGHPRDWAGLYKRDYDLVAPASTAHPAKASWDLAFKILEHLEEMGLANPKTDTCLDFMAGTGRFPLAACAKGFKAIGVELEPRFVEFCQQNKAYAEKKLGREMDWQIIQGDARHLSQLLQERGLISVVSPPYGEALEGTSRHTKGGIPGRDPKFAELGGAGFQAEGNIASLPDRPLIALTSPPYEDSKKGDGYTATAERVRQGKYKGKRPDVWVSPTNIASQGFAKGYGDQEGQIGQERGPTYLSEMKLC